MAQGKITAKQEEILEYIKSQILERGFPPSVRDICEAVHLKSTSSVHSHLETLEKNGYIAKVDLYIYEETCIFLKKCMDEGIPLHPVSVNLSRVGFYNPNRFQTLCEIAERYQIPRKYLELENAGAGFEELEKLTLGGLRKAVVEGDVKNGSVMAGQIAGMVKERMSCKELIRKLVTETDALIGGNGFYE